MITLLNIWHYIFLAIAFSIFVSGIVVAIKKENSKLKYQIIFSFFLLSTVFGVFSLFVVDQYTKEAKVHRVENKRNLYTEKIMYSGIVRNEGNYEIGEVTFEIKLVNGKRSGSNFKEGDFFKPNSFFNFFSGSSDSNNKPQQVSQEFVIAKNLKPKESREFIVYLDYPPYFSGVTDFFYIYAH